MNLGTILDALQPQTNQAAANAANAALNEAAARPFQVIITVDDATKIWLSVMVLLGLAAAVMKR